MQPPDPTPPQTPPPLSQFSSEAKGSYRSDLLEPGESVIRVVHRHPVGIVAIFAVAALALAAISTLIIYLSPNTFNNDPTTSLMVFGIVIIVALIAAYVYRQSKILVTDRSLVQIIQSTLFIRKASHLSMSNVEDVSAEQRGVLATVFNYGTLMVQTAGETDNFVFKLCPHPNELADFIIEARQRYAQSLEEDNEHPSPRSR